MYRNSSGEYTRNKNYPVIYEREKDSVIKTAPEIAEGKETSLDLSNQTQLIERNEGGTTGAKTANTSIHPKQTYYYWDYNAFKTKMKNYETGKTYESILLPKGSSTNYWINSRCIGLVNEFCNYYVRVVDSGQLGAYWLYDSTNDADGTEKPFGNRMLSYVFPV